MIATSPPVVAKAGLMACRISVSRFAEVSSENQKHDSSQIAAMHVTPRNRRQLAALVSISMPFA
jgi:hypothetical protein